MFIVLLLVLGLMAAFVVWQAAPAGTPDVPKLTNDDVLSITRAYMASAPPDVRAALDMTGCSWDASYRGRGAWKVVILPKDTPCTAQFRWRVDDTTGAVAPWQ